MAAHGPGSQGDLNSQPSPAQMLGDFRKVIYSLCQWGVCGALAGLRIQRDSVCEAPVHEAWHTGGLRKHPLWAAPLEGSGMSESEVPQSQSIVFAAKPPTLLHRAGSSTAHPQPRCWGAGGQQPWKCSSFTVPQQGLCFPPLAQALSPLRSPELKGTRCLH